MENHLKYWRGEEDVLITKSKKIESKIYEIFTFIDIFKN